MKYYLSLFYDLVVTYLKSIIYKASSNLPVGAAFFKKMDAVFDTN